MDNYAVLLERHSQGPSTVLKYNSIGGYYEVKYYCKSLVDSKQLASRLNAETEQPKTDVDVLSRENIVQAREIACKNNGILIDNLLGLEDDEGVDAVVGWLESHNFWGLAEDWKNWYFLLN